MDFISCNAFFFFFFILLTIPASLFVHSSRQKLRNRFGRLNKKRISDKLFNKMVNSDSRPFRGMYGTTTPEFATSFRDVWCGWENANEKKPTLSQVDDRINWIKDVKYVKRTRKFEYAPPRWFRIIEMIARLEHFGSLGLISYSFFLFLMLATKPYFGMDSFGNFYFLS